MVGWLVHLCPAGRESGNAATGVFRINAKNVGQFERTLIIVDEGAQVHYVEGYAAPVYSSDSLHSAVVEIIVKKGARCRYTTIQNWSTNVQPRHQTRSRLRGRDDGVGGRQFRVPCRRFTRDHA